MKQDLNDILEGSVFSGLCRTVDRCTAGAASATQFLQDIDRCRSYFRASSDAAPREFYDSVIYAFSRRYLPVNMVKNIYLIDELYHLGLLKDLKQIVDLGSGPGTFVLALAVWLHQAPQDLGTFDVKMVDASKNALDLFKTLWVFLDHGFRSRLRTDLVHSVIDKSAHPLCEGADLVVLSNSLVEILRRDGFDREVFSTNLANSRAVIAIIDYKYDESSRYLESFFEHMGGEYKVCPLRDASAPTDYYQEVSLPTVRAKSHVSCCNRTIGEDGVRFISSILVPKNNKCSSGSEAATFDLVNRYKQAWESHNVDLLDTIFTSNALYYEKADAPPFEGLTNIAHYWQVNAAQQSRVSFTPRHVVLEGDELWVYWSCNFFRRDKGSWYYLNGTFNARIEKGKICRFEESFEKQIRKEEVRKDNVKEQTSCCFPLKK